jgi:hypothetical protein
MDKPGKLPIAEYRRFESFREYETLVDDSIVRTENIIRVFDRELSRNWNSVEREQLLRDFLRRSPANRLMIVVHNAQLIEREFARFLALNQHFTHAIKIRETLRVAKHVYDPFVVFDASHYVHRFHYNHMRAAQGTHDVEGAQLLLDRFSEIWEASAPAVSANVSGL